MSRLFMRLAAWLSVAAFLFANTHTSAALSALVQPSKAKAAAVAGKRTCCSHCKARPAKPAPVRASQTTISATDNDHSSCPCCPERGPCPDGCVLCGVAKLPATVVAVVFVDQSPSLAETWTGPVLCHGTTLAGELMRPPRC